MSDFVKYGEVVRSALVLGFVAGIFASAEFNLLVAKSPDSLPPAVGR